MSADLLDRPKRQPKQEQPSPDRLPPNDTGIEQAVLGCIIEDAAQCLPECVIRLSADGKDFYDLRHQTIWLRALAMYDAGKKLDLRLLNSELKSAGELEQIGGLAYLSSLPDTVLSTANLPDYLDKLLDLSRRRQLLQACVETAGAVWEEKPTPELVEGHERAVLGILSAAEVKKQKTMKENVVAALSTIEAIHQSGGSTGILTGIRDLDRMTCGLQNTDMIVIAGRPSTGKTSLAMQIAEYAAVDNKIPVGVFSLEMTASSLTTRTLCSRARVNQKDMRQGCLSAGDFVKLTAAAPQLANAPLHIDDTPGLSIIGLRAKARRMHQLYGIKLFVIDYLGRLNAGKRTNSRQEEIAVTSSGCKDLATELNVPVLVLCQLNRDAEKGAKTARKPRMCDLRESGAIEQDADVIGLLWRPDPEEEALVQLVIDKQRNGPTGDVNLHFFKEYTRFDASVAYHQEELVNE